jgi:hypothetical protein
VCACGRVWACACVHVFLYSSVRSCVCACVLVCACLFECADTQELVAQIRRNGLLAEARAEGDDAIPSPFSSLPPPAPVGAHPGGTMAPQKDAKSNWLVGQHAEKTPENTLESSDTTNMKRLLQKLGAACYGCQVQVDMRCNAALHGRRGRVLSFASVPMPEHTPASPSSHEFNTSTTNRPHVPRVVCVCELLVDGYGHNGEGDKVQVVTIDSEHLVRVSDRPVNFCVLPEDGSQDAAAGSGDGLQTPWERGALVRYIGGGRGQAQSGQSVVARGGGSPGSALISGATLGTISSVDVGRNTVSVYVADAPEVRYAAERAPSPK